MAESKYPVAVDPEKVGTYPGRVYAGGSYFYDEVLEYRVWMCSHLCNYRGSHSFGDASSECDTYEAFATYEEAEAFSKRTKGAETPDVLVLQREWINELEDKSFVHIKKERLTEWSPEMLVDTKRNKDSIVRFLEKHKKR